ncbi:MAG: PAS domain S-box protein [Thermodesulfobacteriota bacterium]
MAAQSMLRLIDAMDALEDGIYIVGEDYVVEYMNKAMIQLFGEGVGKKCFEVLNDRTSACPWCKYQDILASGSRRDSETYISKVDRTFHVVERPVSNKDGSMSKISIYRDITHSKKQEARLKSSEENYKRLFEHAGCGVFVSSKQGRFLDVNPALLRMMGYDDKEAFLALDLATAIYLKPEDRKKYQETVEKKGSVVGYEVEWKKKDGSTIQVLLTSNVRYDPEGNIEGYEGIVIDQSERKKMEDKMKEALDFLDKTIQCSPNAIMAANLKGELIIWNNGAEGILGYKAADVIGRMNVAEVYPPGVARTVMKMLRSDDYGGKGVLRSYPLVVKNIRGEEIEGNLSAGIIYDEQGREIATVGIFVDLGEWLTIERTLSQTRQQLLQSEKLAAMGRLTSQIAHELNNPLYGIMNTLELLKTEVPPTNKRRKLLDMSLSEVERLADMLKKMLSFSKPDEVKKSNININTVLEEILLFYEKRFKENSIKARAEFTAEPGLVHASRDQLRQVFINIISNAMDAMPDGGGLKVATARKSDSMVITISDTGTGIKEEYIEKIFDSFFTTKKDSVKGVGLGLSVCYGFIKDHGGDIQVVSKPGEGATFIITLPISQDA